MTRNTIQAVLIHPDAVERMARLQDALDAEYVKAAVYSPWVDLLAGAARGNRRRTLSKRTPPPAGTGEGLDGF